MQDVNVCMVSHEVPLEGRGLGMSPRAAQRLVSPVVQVPLIPTAQH